ncbi:MAG: Zn-dependent hydrolase, partial [Bacteroidales bacterium]|nr:Zn-dependent hydrolase [Bacteroidales bacterium]
THLIEKGEITNISVADAITTFIAGIFRSVRFGAASSHGKANMMCFNTLKQHGAFTRDAKGIYTINYEQARLAINFWAGYILSIQGDGDYQGAVEYRSKYGVITPELQKDLDRINQAGIPRDIRFNQGVKTLGL